MNLTLRTCMIAFSSFLSIRLARADAPARADDLARADMPAARALARADIPARADAPVSEPVPTGERLPPAAIETTAGDYARTPAFEVNVLWPFFPGGIVDLKALVPIVRTDRKDFRGELIAGLHSDFSWGPVSRPVDQYGKVSILAAKLGYRQFLLAGLHFDITVNLGWRHEENNIYDGGRLDGFIGRSWLFAGYQHEFSRQLYANVRGGAGVHLFRTDRFGDKERVFVPAGDLNVGLRF